MTNASRTTRRSPARVPTAVRATRALAAALGAALAVLAAPVHAAKPDPLPALGVRVEETTVSGVSSGGYMAVQFHVAHSRIVRGAGVIAAGPYFCAQGSVWMALVDCMKPTRLQPVPEARLLMREAAAFAAAGRIDPLAHLAGGKAWLFSGTQDGTVDRAVVAALDRFYREYLQAAAVIFVDDLPAGHAMITADIGAACGATAPPFINDCDFDAAGELLRHVAGPLRPPGTGATGGLVRFDQDAFVPGGAGTISMAAEGFAFVPTPCRRGGCRVHVAFHGCRQGVDAIGRRFVTAAGYNRWAETNGLIVLYPQVVATGGWAASLSAPRLLHNPRGCWDWWGYTGGDYATQSGAQVRAVRAMLERLAETPAGASVAGD